MNEVEDTKTKLRVAFSILLAARSSIASSIQRSGHSTMSVDLANEVSIKIENLRLKLMHLSNSLKNDSNGIDAEIYHECIRQWNKLTRDEDFRYISSENRLRRTGETRALELVESVYPHIFDENSSIMDGVNAAYEFFERPFEDLPAVDRDALRVSSIRTSIPNQQVAPLQFDISNGKLLTSEMLLSVDEEDQANLKNAKGSVVAGGRKLLDKLRASNCDRRIIESFESVQSLLDNDENPIVLGIANLACLEISERCDEELSLATSSLVKAQSRAVELYVRQYPEWNRFVNNAFNPTFSKEEIEKLSYSTEDMISSLENFPESIEDKIPILFRNLNRTVSINNPRKSSVAIAVVRSVENMLSKIFSWSATFISETLSETTKETAKFISKTAVVFLLGIALNAAGVLTPLINKMPELSWIPKVIDVMQKQLSNLK